MLFPIVSRDCPVIRKTFASARCRTLTIVAVLSCREVNKVLLVIYCYFLSYSDFRVFGVSKRIKEFIK